MKLTEDQLQEIKEFLEDKLNQEIDIRLIHSMTWNEALSNFFFRNLVKYISPETSETVNDFIYSLIKLKPKKKKKFKFVPFLFGN